MGRCVIPIILVRIIRLTTTLCSSNAERRGRTLGLVDAMPSLLACLDRIALGRAGQRDRHAPSLLVPSLLARSGRMGGPREGEGETPPFRATFPFHQKAGSVQTQAEVPPPGGHEKARTNRRARALSIFSTPTGQKICCRASSAFFLVSMLLWT